MKPLSPIYVALRMDRGVRNSIARETRRTVAAIRQNAYELSCTLESVKSDEEAKLYNIPESFSGSSKAEEMEEDVMIFDDALELISSGLGSINDVAEILGVEVAHKPYPKLKKNLLSAGRKGVRFQMLLPEAMKMELRSASESSYVSKNEMVCRALKEYLSGTDYK